MTQIETGSFEKVKAFFKQNIQIKIPAINLNDRGPASVSGSGMDELKKVTPLKIYNLEKNKKF
ncbi:MAG: hypothetical protein ACXVC3_17335 [Bdellovibrio sp.]